MKPFPLLWLACAACLFACSAPAAPAADAPSVCAVSCADLSVGAAAPAAYARPAADDKRYAVAPTEDVWFYAGTEESERLFLLPCTYYVRVLDEGETYCTVEYLVDDAPYQKIIGYCRTEQLLFVDFTPVRPYLRKQVTLTYTLPDTGSLGDETLSAIERTFVYYGERTEDGQLYYYVSDGERFGYVAADVPVVYERNTDYLEAVSGEEEGDDPQPAAEGVGTVQIVVICILCGAAVLVAVLVLRGKRSAGRSSSDF